MDELLSTLAHELRNVLAPLRNALDRLQRPGTTDEVKAQSIAMISRQIGQLCHLADELGDVSSIGSGAIELQKALTDLPSIFDSAVEAARPSLERHHHRLSVQGPERSIRLEADHERVVQIIVSLLENAAANTDANGEISLIAEVAGGRAIVRVRDNGRGIEPHLLSRIFDPFVRPPRSPERSPQKVGIGLTLARHLAELHGGSLAALSAGAGQGSEFTLELPVCTARAAYTSADDGAVTEGARLRILVADDNVDYADSTALILRMDGHEVHTAYDGLQAMELVTALHPDVVLLDIGLPELDGYEVASRIRAMSGQEGIFLVAVTGRGREKDAALREKGGFDHHLVKPVDPDALRRLLTPGVKRTRSPQSANESTAATARDEASATSSTAGGRVLLVDDNADVLTSAADMLGSVGYEVQTTADARAALELAASWRPRYVLVDIHMPVMNGFELARELRARFSAAQMKLVMMSGMATNDVLEDSARSAGFDACIDKMAETARWVEILQPH